MPLPPAGLTYRLGRTLYIALTNSCNAVSLIDSRGPGFSMSAESGFARLPEGFTPSVEEVLSAVDAASDFDAIAFAGAGEPLLKQRLLETACASLRERGGTWDSYSFTTAVTAHGKSGQWRAALDVLWHMDSSEEAPPPNEYVPTNTSAVAENSKVLTGT